MSDTYSIGTTVPTYENISQETTWFDYKTKNLKIIKKVPGQIKYVCLILDINDFIAIKAIASIGHLKRDIH